MELHAIVHLDGRNSPNFNGFSASGVKTILKKEFTLEEPQTEQKSEEEVRQDIQDLRVSENILEVVHHSIMGKRDVLFLILWNNMHPPPSLTFRDKSIRKEYLRRLKKVSTSF